MKTQDGEGGRKSMRSILRRLLPLSVPLLAFAYGVGDHLSWWDDLRGRTELIASYNRLSSTKGFPTIFICDDDPQFSGLYSFLQSRTQEDAIREFNSLAKMPTCIVRAGGALGHELQKQMPPDWPDVTFVSETLPIMFVYEYAREDKVLNGMAFRVCSLGDLRRWIEESRHRERFYVITVLFGLLSILIVILKGGKNQED